MSEWFADEAFWEVFYPAIFPDERFEAAGEEADKILHLVQFKGRSILDLACGPGRHSLALAEKGFSVTGVDLSTFLLNRAKDRAQAAGVEVEFVQQDMRQFRRPGAFDLCLSLFTSFGYFESREDDLTVLRNIYDSLTAGGACLIDVVGKEILAKNFMSTTSVELEDGTLVFQRHEICDDWSTIKNRWILLKEGRVADYQFQHTIYSAQELNDRYADAGFGTVEIYGDFDGSGYGPGARRLIAVGRK